MFCFRWYLCRKCFSHQYAICAAPDRWRSFDFFHRISPSLSALKGLLSACVCVSVFAGVCVCSVSVCLCPVCFSFVTSFLSCRCCFFSCMLGSFNGVVCLTCCCIRSHSAGAIVLANFTDWHRFSAAPAHMNLGLFCEVVDSVFTSVLPTDRSH